MKKILTIVSAVILSIAAANAQGGLLGTLKNAAGGVLGQAANEAVTATTEATGSDALGGLLGGLLGDLLNTVTTVSLPGTWKYYSVATAISSDNTLVTLASSAYKNKLEDKLNGYLAKIGIKQGSAVFTFTEAGEFTISSGSKVIASGTYAVDKDNNVQMKFGKLYSYLTLSGKLAATPSGCQILFEANRFLEFVKKAVAVAGKLVNTDSVASLLADANGLQLGFILTR